MKAHFLATVFFIGGFVAVNSLLWIVLWGERVKKDLRKNGFAPIHVRWRPFGYWAILAETPYLATYVDMTGCIQTTRCCVVWDGRVRWIRDDWVYLDKDLPLIGRLAYLLMALGLLAFGTKHLVRQTLISPARWSNHSAASLHGWPVIFFSFAVICFAAHLATHVVYCSKNGANQKTWTLMAGGFLAASWLLFWLSLIIGLYQLFQSL